MKLYIYPTRYAFSLLICIITICITIPGHAQQELEAIQGDTAASGEDEYRPLGLHLGSFYFYPVAEIGVKQDSNVFRVPDGLEESDTILFTDLSASLNSDWNRHSLNAFVLASLGYYDEFESENYQRFTATANGRYDVVENSLATARMGFTRREKDRSSLDDRGTSEPTKYDTSYIGIGYDHMPSRLRSLIQLDYVRTDFNNNISITGEVIDNSDRDRSTPLALFRLEYENLPERGIFVEALVNAIIYDEKIDNKGIERSSTGYKITTGLNFDLTNLLVGDIFIGYLEQNYDDPAAANLQEPLFGFGLVWYPTRLTTVYLDLDRKPLETTSSTAVGYLSTIFSTNVEHELLRNTTLTGNLTFRDNKYNQIIPGSKESEKYVFAGLGATYLFSRRFYTSASYEYGKRDSDIDTQDYKGHRGILTLGANW